MIFSVTFSKPSKNILNYFDKDYLRIKAKLVTSSPSAKSSKALYLVEFYTQKQVFHERFSEEELLKFIDQHGGKSFKNCIIRTDSEEISILANKKGEITQLKKNIKSSFENITQNNRQKNYLLKEGTKIPYLIHLGIMTPEGKIISSKYDKFKQINRFLEFIDDILPNVIEEIKKENNSETINRPIQIIDFGSGKSYLTFAVHYFLTEIKHLPVEIIGLDLKEDVIDYCNKLADKLNYTNLKFFVGDISSYEQNISPDIVITLHACDTATDYALNYAIKKQAKAILSVPCCQHEINFQLEKSKKTISENSPFLPILKYGILKEKLSSIITDSIRAELLESSGYKVQLLEFIDISHTPKNILIRAIRKPTSKFSMDKNCKSYLQAKRLLDSLQLNHSLEDLLK